MKRAAFITVEGPDGAGKSTQTRLLAASLEKAGYDVVLTREPGGTALGSRLRQLLLDPRNDVAPMTEVLLMAADRAQHVEEVIRPALANNKIVVCDRYIDSSLAYQGYALLKRVEPVRMINEAATGGLWPDLTLLLDVEPAVGLQRVAAAAAERQAHGPDRIEQRKLEFHSRVRRGYHKLQQAEPARFVLIDTTRMSVAEVAAQVWKAVKDKLGIAINGCRGIDG